MLSHERIGVESTILSSPATSLVVRDSATRVGALLTTVMVKS